MRRIALSLTVACGLAVLAACGTGSGTGFNGEPANNPSDISSVLLTDNNGTQTNLFFLQAPAVPLPPPATAPPGGVAPTANPAPAAGTNPIVVFGEGKTTGGGIIGGVGAPGNQAGGIQFVWTAVFTTPGTTVPNSPTSQYPLTTCGTPVVAPANTSATPPPVALPPIPIDFQFAATTTNPAPANPDAAHPGYAILQPGQFVNPIALWAPVGVTFAKGSANYCITVTATTASGVAGTANVVVTGSIGSQK